jgi:putative CocE/NonD family hydrolase
MGNTFASKTVLFGTLVALAGLGACSSPTEETEGRASSDAGEDMIVETDVAVPMRDGTILRADIYRPANDGPYPVLVYRTPYGKQGAVRSYQTHASAVARGYAVVIQDVRGRYASEGLFNPYRNEGRDGYDTIEWAAAQPWSNGRVGTYGLSYPGAVQWLAAVETPPHLEAMVPAMTFSQPGNFFYMNGVFDLSWLPWIYTNIAPDARVRLGLDGITDDAEADAEWDRAGAGYRAYLPLGELPWLREEAPFYFEWLSHPPEDPWWSWADLRPQYRKVNAAVLNLSGWHDEAYGPEGAITNFSGLVAARSGAESPRTHLVIGPWTHGVGATMTRVTGDVDFGADAAIDYDVTLLRFFDYYLKDIDNGLGAEPAVRQFVMGANSWQQSWAWPLPDVQATDLYIAEEQGLTGQMPGTGGQYAFLADPTQPVADPYDEFGPHDYRELVKRPDLLVFETAPMAEDLQVTGATEAVLYVSCDCRDFDLWVKLLDVAPDGSAFNLMSPGADVQRVSYRNPGQGRQLIQPGRVYEVRLPGLLTSNLFLRGHRLRAIVSASFAPHLSRNLQTGESEISHSRSQKAEITLHYGDRYPARLVVPVVPAS